MGAGDSPSGKTTAPRLGSLSGCRTRCASSRRTSSFDELLAEAKTEEQIVGPGGLLSQLTKRLVEWAIEVELTDHLATSRVTSPRAERATRATGRRRSVSLRRG